MPSSEGCFEVRKEALKKHLRQIFSDWGDDFTWAITETHTWDRWSYFEVTIRHKFADAAPTFTMRVSLPEEFEICDYEDVYSPLDDVNLWRRMWFEATLP